MRRILHALTPAMILFACHASRGLGLPEAPEDTRTMLLAVDPPVGALSVTAFRWPEDKPRVASFPRDAAVTILYYPTSLDTLGIDAGPVKNAIGEPMVRPLPTPSTTFEGARGSDGLVESWDAVGALPGELRDFRIAGGTPQDCAGSGGCFENDEARMSNACSTPCPTPTAPTPPADVMPPSPPIQTPCPAMWREVAVDDVTVCEPPARVPCRDWQLIDQITCDGVSMPCPADGWPTSIPTARPVRYVDAAFMGMSDGTIGMPYTTIGDALSGAPASVALALRRGTHAVGTDITVNSDLEIVGACTETIVDVNDVIVASQRLGLSNLTLRGQLVSAASNTSLEIRDVVFTMTSVASMGADVTLNRVVFDQPANIAVVASGGTLGTLHVLIRGGVRGAFDIRDGAVASIADTVVEDVAGHGALITSQASVDIQRSYFDRATDDTIDVVAAEATLDHVVIVNGRASGGEDGRALHASDGATVEITRGWFSKTDTSGVRLDRATLTMTDTVIRESRPVPSTNDHGMSLAILSNSSATLTRVDFADSYRTGINEGGDSSLSGSDIRIRRVQRGVARAVGVGIAVSGASSTVIERVAIEGPASIGLQLDAESPCRSAERTGRLSFTDLLISDNADLRPQVGVDATCKAEPRFVRTRVQGTTRFGVDLNQEAVLTADDLTIADAGARALELYDDARIEGTRVAILDTDVALSADFRGKIFLDHALIRCSEDGAKQNIGVRQKNFGEIHLDAFEVKNCEIAFWVASTMPFVDLQDGWVHKNAVALEQDFDVADFLLGVLYEDNDELARAYEPNRD